MIDDRPADAAQTGGRRETRALFCSQDREMIRWREDGVGPSRTHVYVGDRLCT